MFRTAILCTTLLALTACGGGGGGDSNVSAVTPVAVELPAPAASVALPAEASVITASPDEQLAAAMDAAASAAALPDVVASAVVAQASKSTEGSDVAVALTPLPPVVDSSSGAMGGGLVGAIYYVNSSLGSDSYTGLAATVQTGNAGPWKTLAKLALANLQPGDTVRLACGSEWNETLRLANSGSSVAAITVTSWPSACSNRPAITGSTTIPTSNWVQHQGNIFRAPLAQAPLQVHHTAGALNKAHHPNRGFDTQLPQSPYLQAAADSDRVTVNGLPVSTYVSIGTDLRLPSGLTTVPVGTTVRVRTTSWSISERTVSAASTSRLTLSTPTSHPVTKGWGYYLLGQLWMLDSPGEWHWDSASNQLFAWMPDSRAPSSAVHATTLQTGVDLESRNYIAISNLAVSRVGTGINLRKSIGSAVRNSRISDTAELGINAAASQGVIVQANTVERTGSDAITGQDDILAAAVGMQVLDNTVTESAVLMAGETILSLPVNSRAAVRPGTSALVRGNTITDTAYNGIRTLANSTISNNVVTGACTTLDDCGAIYVSSALNGSVISGNLVRNSRGAIAGKAPGSAYTQAQGIYLDEYASGVVVTGNSAINSDHGIHLHISNNNRIQDNRLFGNRTSQLWMQEDRNARRTTGDVYGNVVTGNQIVPTSPTATGIYLDTEITNTLLFGSIDSNRYFDRIYPRVATERIPGLRTEYTLAQWRTATTLQGQPRGLDELGTGVSQTLFASIQVKGTNIVPNGSLGSGSTGWSAWNQTQPYGYLVREPCVPGTCARYVTGGSPGILSSPNFSIVGGQWYRLTVDLATGTDGQVVQIVVRRGGGGSNGYESLSSKSLATTANRNWVRYSHIFQASKTINAGDAVTKDLGARVDFQQIQPGQSVSAANLEIVPITPADALTRSEILVNTAASAVQVSCPLANTNPALCTQFVRLLDNLPVAWPYLVAARSAEVIYTRDAALVDTDGDGIPDTQDRCGNSPAGQGVNSQGCALSQR